MRTREGFTGFLDDVVSGDPEALRTYMLLCLLKGLRPTFRTNRGTLETGKTAYTIDEPFPAPATHHTDGPPGWVSPVKDGAPMHQRIDSISRHISKPGVVVCHHAPAAARQNNIAYLPLDRETLDDPFKLRLFLHDTLSLFQESRKKVLVFALDRDYEDHETAHVDSKRLFASAGFACDLMEEPDLNLNDLHAQYDTILSRPIIANPRIGLKYPLVFFDLGDTDSFFVFPMNPLYPAHDPRYLPSAAFIVTRGDDVSWAMKDSSRHRIRLESVRRSLHSVCPHLGLDTIRDATDLDPSNNPPEIVARGGRGITSEALNAAIAGDARHSGLYRIPPSAL